MERKQGTAREFDDRVFDGLQTPAQEFLLHMLLYKSVFYGEGFHALVSRETNPALRERLLRISDESVEEAEAVAHIVREWDSHPGVWGHVSVTVGETRAQLLHDLIRLKEGMTEAGLFAAMRAPNKLLRDRFLKLVDVDRRHADELRAFLGATTTTAFREAQEHGLGAHDARDRRTSLSGAIRARLDQLRRKGANGRRIIVSAAGLRHLRDEQAVAEDGRCLGLPLDIDLGWEGDVYAIQTDERLTYAELLVAMHTDDEGHGVATVPGAALTAGLPPTSARREEADAARPGCTRPHFVHRSAPAPRAHQAEPHGRASGARRCGPSRRT